MGNAVRQDDVESGHPIGGDDEKLITQIVDIAHLATARQRNTGKLGRRNDASELSQRRPPFRA